MLLTLIAIFSFWLTIFSIIHCCWGVTCSIERPFLVLYCGWRRWVPNKHKTLYNIYTMLGQRHRRSTLAQHSINVVQIFYVWWVNEGRRVGPATCLCILHPPGCLPLGRQQTTSQSHLTRLTSHPEYSTSNVIKYRRRKTSGVSGLINYPPVTLSLPCHLSSFSQMYMYITCTVYRFGIQSKTPVFNP